jgi:hypothetical protein
LSALVADAQRSGFVMDPIVLGNIDVERSNITRMRTGLSVASAVPMPHAASGSMVTSSEASVEASGTTMVLLPPFGSAPPLPGSEPPEPASPPAAPLEPPFSFTTDCELSLALQAATGKAASNAPHRARRSRRAETITRAKN